jgi:hypothetical protein
VSGFGESQQLISQHAGVVAGTGVRQHIDETAADVGVGAGVGQVVASQSVSAVAPWSARLRGQPPHPELPW